MKFSTIILFVVCFQVSLNGHAQGITLSEKNAPLEKVFKEIKKQTGYSFLYSSEVIKQSHKVNIEIRNATLEETLKACFTNQPLTWEIEEKTIIVKPKPEDPKKKSALAIVIKGRIVNEKAEPVFASITIKGTTQGTTTNENGEFQLNGIDENAILIITGANIETREIKVAGKPVLTIAVKIKITTQEEVIVNAGYYKVKQREGTGSISRVDAKTIEKQPVTNPLAAISGRMTGVYIQQTTGIPGGEFNILIRGRNSLRDDGNQPLYIIDGVPFSTDKTFSSYVQSEFGYTFFTTGVSNVSPLTSINPSDIESIEVLKDADATAIYGSRGANGVVLITTKKGKAGKTTFDLNVYTGAGKASHEKLMNTQQYLAIRREAFANEGLIPSANPADPGYAPDLMIWDTTRYTDWQKVLMGGSAQTTSMQSSISGGNDNTQFLFGLGYRSENSIYPGDLGYRKGSFHLSVNHQSTGKKFSISINMNGAKDKNNQLGYSLSSAARILPPNAPPLYDDNGKLNWANSTWQNPLGLRQVSYDNTVVNFTGNTVVGYELFPGLQFKTSFGVNYLQSQENTKYPHTTADPAIGFTSAQSSVYDASGINQSWIIEPQANWDRKIAKGKLIVLIGSTFQGQQLERRADRYFGFPSDALMDNLASASQTSNYESVQALYRYMALFGRFNYNWDKKYILNLTARRDGSSRFGPGKRFANFGAAGISWIFSKEKWIEKLFPFLNFGKLRTSYGITGSDQIGDYQYLDTYTTNTDPSINNQYQGVTWLAPTRLFNPDYSWEVNKKFEAALELGFLNDHFTIMINYFSNRSSSQLVNYTLPRTTGFSGVLANLPATVQNTGWEVELMSVNLGKTHNFQWTTSFNITIPRNKLIEFPNLESSTYTNRYVMGEPLSSFKVFESTGVDPQTGLFTIRDMNGDGKISLPEDAAKAVFVGQDFYGGVNNSFSYRGLSLDIFFQFVKQTGFEFWRSSSGISLGERGNVPVILLDKTIWRKPGDIAELQKISMESNNPAAYRARVNHLFSDATIGDASFIRLKNVSLSYQLPKKWTKDIQCRFYFQGQNLLLITNYEGDDPENQFFNSVSPLRMFTIGVQLTL